MWFKIHDERTDIVLKLTTFNQRRLAAADVEISQNTYE